MDSNFKISTDQDYTYSSFIQDILDNRGRFNCLKREYKERHHILPRAEGGKNDTENLIDLYPREHFIAHKLLAKENPDVLSYQRAYFCMAFLKNDYEKRENAITPEEYEQTRKEASGFLITLIMEIMLQQEKIILIIGRSTPKKFYNELENE